MEWLRLNAAALATIVAILVAITSTIWYLATLVGSLAPTAAVVAVDDKVDALSVKAETLATTEAVDLLSDKVDRLQAMFPLMMSCIIEQNRQILLTVGQGSPAPPDIPVSCETALALAQQQAGATGQ